jgi:hypothetical protein
LLHSTAAAAAAASIARMSEVGQIGVPGSGLHGSRFPCGPSESLGSRHLGSRGHNSGFGGPSGI